MKKIARLALALATVMSIPTSAMALMGTETHHVKLVNGRQHVNVGNWRFMYDQIAVGPDADYCSYFVKWTNYAGLPSSANTYLEHVMPLGYQDCEESAFFPQHTMWRTSMILYPDMSKGYDKFQQKRNMYRIILSEDGFTGNLTGICQYHALSTPIGCGAYPQAGAAPIGP